MKSLSTLFLLVFCSCQFAFSQYYIHTPEGKKSLDLSSTTAVVKFKAELSFAHKKTLLAKEPAIKTLDEKMLLPAPEVCLLSFQEGTTKDDLLKILSRLKQLPEVHYAHPMFTYGGENKLGIQEDFFVKIKQASDLSLLRQWAKNYQTIIVEQDAYTPTIYRLELLKESPYNALQLANLFHESGRFTFAEPNFLMVGKFFQNTNDPYVGVQWALNNTGQVGNGTPGADMNVFNAWSISTGSSGIRVAIVDSGVELNHPDLAANLLPGYDATGQGSNGGPAYGLHPGNAHGTACAGLVAALGNNNIGMAGVAYSSKIIPVRYGYVDAAGNNINTGTTISNALNWAWDIADADILSNSWGGGLPSFVIDQAIENAVNNGRGGLGSVVLFAAGNENSVVSYPASNWRTIAVGATSMCDERKSPSSCDGVSNWGSNSGTGLDVAAPGVTIFSTDLSGADGYNSGGSYPANEWEYTGYYGGTSAACPNAAGVMALILSVDPNLNVWDARGILEASCDKVGGYTYNPGVPGQPAGTWSNDLGHGRVNAYEALLLAGGNSSCGEPMGLFASNIANTTATINWGTVANADNYTVEIREVGTSWFSFTANPFTGNGINVTGMEACTEYEFRVRANCGSTSSNFVTSSVFETTGCTGGTCEVPTGISVSAVGHAFFFVEWDEMGDANHYEVRYRPAGTSSWVNLTDWNGTQHISGNKVPCTTYEWQVRSSCGSNFSSWSSLRTINTEGCGDSYCYSYGLTWDDWIARVRLGAIDNQTGKNYGYGSYTSISTEVEKGESYTIRLTSDTDDDAETVFWRVWVDFNQDNDFNDSGEMVFQQSSSNSQQITGSFSIPGTALSGSTRMRVSMSLGDYSAPCATGNFREVEDYTLQINQPCSFPTQPQLNQSGTISFCEGNQVTLSVLNPCSSCTYQWSNGQSGTSIVVNTPGAYSVTATNDCGTSPTSSTIILVEEALPTSPNISANGSTELCAGESVTLSASNVCSGCTITWSNGQTGNSITVTSAGNYSAVAVSSNCGISNASNVIPVTTASMPNPATVSANGSTELCPGESVVLTASGVCNACTVQWSNGQSGISISVSTPGVYMATVVNDCGSSSASNSISVTTLAAPSIPVLIANGATTFCPGQTVVLTATNVCNTCTIQWSNGQTGTSITVSVGGVYTAVAINSCGSSAVSNSISLNMVEPPNAPVISADGPTILCPGESVNLVASNVCTGCTVIWSNGQSGISITVNTAGSYTAFVTENTCNLQSTISTTIVVSTGDFSPVPELSQSGEIVLCEGETAMVSVENICDGCTVNWSNGTSGPSIILSTAGTYTATMINNCDVASAASIAIVVVLTEFVPEIEVNNQCYLAAPTGSEYQWFFNGELLGSGQFWTATETGYYTVTMLDANGCIGTSMPLFIDACTTGLRELEQISSMSVFPNPASEWVQIDLALNEGSDLSIELYRMDGRWSSEVHRGWLSSGKHSWTIAVSGLAAGVYAYRLSGARGVQGGMLVLLGLP